MWGLCGRLMVIGMIVIFLMVVGGWGSRGGILMLM